MTDALEYLMFCCTCCIRSLLFIPPSGLQISSLVEGPGKDQLEDMVLTQLASVLSHVLSSQAKDSQEVAEKPRILATVEVVDDTGCQRTKQLLRQLLSELSLSR